MPEQIKLSRGRVINLLSADELQAHAGKKVSVHVHGPAMAELGEPVYSILHKGKVLGQVKGSVAFGLSNAGIKVDKTEAEKLLDPNHPGGKTRNTFVTGHLNPSQFGEEGTPLSVKPGGIVSIPALNREIINFPATRATSASMGGDVSVGMKETPSGFKAPSMIFHDRSNQA